MHRCREKSRTGELCFKLAQGSMELHMTLPSLHISSLRGVHNGSDQGMVLDHLPGTKRANSYSLATVKMMPRRRQRLKKKKIIFPFWLSNFSGRKVLKVSPRKDKYNTKPTLQAACNIGLERSGDPPQHTHAPLTDRQQRRDKEESAEENRWGLQRLALLANSECPSLLARSNRAGFC